MPAPVEPDAAPDIVLPDDTMLVAFFVDERGDPAWRKGPLGWLLRVVPLPFEASLHERADR